MFYSTRRKMFFSVLVSCCLLVLGLPVLAQSGDVMDEFEDGQLDPNWTLVGIGNAVLQSVDESGGTLQLTGDGTTTFLAADNAVFCYREAIGNFRMEVTLDGTNMLTGGNFRKAGLMVRTSLDPWAQRVINFLVPYWQGGPDTHLQTVVREVYGGPGSVSLAQDTIGVPRVLRLAVQRLGDTLSVEYSTDGGATWIQPATGLGGSVTLTGLPDTMQVGLAVVSNDVTETTTATFDDFYLTGNITTPPGRLLITAAEPDVDGGRMWITGYGFGDAAPFNGQVTLSLPGAGEVPLTVQGFDPAAQELLVDLPSGLPAGTFLLAVRTGPDATQGDAFDVTFGAVGPQGEKGEKGEPGTPGGGGLGPFTLGEVVHYEDPKEVVAPSHVAVTAYEVRIPRGGDVRVEYRFFEVGSNLQWRGATSVLYVNGVALQTFRTGSANAIVATADLIGLSPGDVLKVTVRVDNSAQAQYIDAHVKDFKIKAAEPFLHFTQIQ